MPATFLQRVRELCQAQKSVYEQDRSLWFREDHRRLVRLAGKHLITKKEEEEYHNLLNGMECLTFLYMIACRTGNTRQTVSRIIGDESVSDRLLDDKLPRWGTVEAILNASHVDDERVWLLNLHYNHLEIIEGRKIAVTTEHKASVKAPFRFSGAQGITRPSDPSTEPFQPFNNRPGVHRFSSES